MKKSSFTLHEQVEIIIQNIVNCSLHWVDSIVQNGDFTVDGSQMQVHAHLFSVRHRCIEKIWNDKGPLEGPSKNFKMPPLGWQWIRSCLKTFSYFFPVDN
ncbi:MAG: hypothetical protein RLZZ49_922 [Bacteroidota bacterium]